MTPFRAKVLKDFVFRAAVIFDRK